MVAVHATAPIARRAALVALTATLPAHIASAGAGGADGPDAALLALAAELREAEGRYRRVVEGLGRAEGRDAVAVAAMETEAADASDAVTDLIERMAETPALTAVGIAAKAGRLAWSVASGSGPLYAEAELAASLLADVQRLVPAANPEVVA